MLRQSSTKRWRSAVASMTRRLRRSRSRQLGNCARSFGEPDRALHLLDQAIVWRRAYGDRRALGLTESAAALARATAGDLAGAEASFRRTHERFRAADDAPAEGGALLMWGLAVEGTGDAERAADLLVAGAEVWDRGLTAAFPGWGLLAAADGLLNAGRLDEARGFAARAARVFDAAGITPAASISRAHPAAKSAQRGSKEAAS